MDNQTMLQFFEWYLPADAGHWKRAQEQAKKLRELGFTSVWLPPAYKGASGIQDVGYAPYDYYDLGEFDQKGSVPTKYGTRGDYLAAAGQLQATGLAVYADIVFDHMMGADEKETVSAEEDSFTDRTQEIEGPRDIEAWTRFTHPGRGSKYSGFIWDYHCFSGVDWDNRKQEHAIFEFAGKNWDSDVDKENGNYDYLMGANVDFSVPQVVAELDAWGKWYMDTCKLDGFRLDAVKHIHYEFFTGWLKKLRQAAGRPLFAVGEFWSPDLRALHEYLDACGGVMHLFDVPLHYALCQASHSDGNSDLRAVFDNTLVKSRPAWAVTFVDNHDTQAGQALSSWVDGWFKLQAYSLILLRQDGIPCVFYGDLYGIPSQNVNPVGDGLLRLVKARELLAYGDQTDYLDDPYIIGWTRAGDAEHPGSGLAVILTDGAGGEKKMCVGAEMAGLTFVDLLGNRPERLLLDEEGGAVFPVNGGSVSVWVSEEGVKNL